MRGLMMDTPLLVSELIRHAGRVHGTTQIVARTAGAGSVHRYTYADAHARCRRLANATAELGLAAGERAASLAWNTHQHFELFYGISGTGAVLHTVNPRLFDDQLVYIINHAEDRVVFFDRATQPIVERIAPKLATVATWVYMGEPGENVSASLPRVVVYEELLARHSEQYEWPSFDERQASTICYTSGTTGMPKGVVNTNRSSILSALMMSSADLMGGYQAGALEVVMPVAPLFHGNGWQMVYTAPLSGHKLVLPGRNFEPEKLHELLVGEGVTVAAAVPTVWMTLLDHVQRHGLDLGKLRTALVAGTKPPASLVDALERRYGVEVAQCWGMTEALGVTKATPPPGTREASPEIRAAHRQRAGRVAFGTTLRIVDEDGRELPNDGKAQGILQARGPCVAGAYLKMPASGPDGWLDTGDVAKLYPDGSVEIVDRSKDVIKSGGEWISSVTVENAAMEHPAIAQAAVIAMPHPKWQERPRLVVVPRPGARPTPDDIKAHLATRIASWWLPDDIVFVDELPMTGTGKVHKLTLRQQFETRDRV